MSFVRETPWTHRPSTMMTSTHSHELPPPPLSSTTPQSNFRHWGFLQCTLPIATTSRLVSPSLRRITVVYKLARALNHHCRQFAALFWVYLPLPPAHCSGHLLCKPSDFASANPWQPLATLKTPCLILICLYGNRMNIKFNVSQCICCGMLCTKATALQVYNAIPHY